MNLREEAPELLTVAEAAAILRVSRATAYRLIDQKVLPAVKVGGSLRIKADELGAVLETPTAIRVPEDTPE